MVKVKLLPGMVIKDDAGRDCSIRGGMNTDSIFFAGFVVMIAEDTLERMYAGRGIRF